MGEGQANNDNIAIEDETNAYRFDQQKTNKAQGFARFMNGESRIATRESMSELSYLILRVSEWKQKDSIDAQSIKRIMVHDCVGAEGDYILRGFGRSDVT